MRVTPKASRNAISGYYTAADGETSLKVMTTAQPEKGKANKAVIAILAKKFGKAKSLFTVIQGQTDRNKTVLVEGRVEETKRWLIPALEDIENG